MSSRDDSVRAPSPLLLLMESRMVAELATTYLTGPVLRTSARGDGHPVLVLPGYLVGDLSTVPLRRFLRRQGFRAYPWKLGRNLGPRLGVEARMVRRLKELRRKYDSRVSLVGWSLGGLYARELARRSPDDVRNVISLGSPFASNPRANHAWRLFQWTSGQTVEEIERRFADLSQAPPVPTTSIYTRSDGIASWQCCVQPDGPQAESIQVPGSHLGLGVNPLVLHAVADRLAQPEGGWRPFEHSGLRRLFYSRPPNGRR